MSVGMVVLVVMMIVVSAIVGRATMSNRKRFGLKEAKAAARYVGEAPGAAPAVMGVVLGVLGYKNMVAEDVYALAGRMSHDNDVAAKSVEANEAEIERLSNKIVDLQAEIAAKTRPRSPAPKRWSSSSRASLPLGNTSPRGEGPQGPPPLHHLRNE